MSFQNTSECNKSYILRMAANSFSCPANLIPFAAKRRKREFMEQGGSREQEHSPRAPWQGPRLCCVTDYRPFSKERRGKTIKKVTFGLSNQWLTLCW